MREKFILNAEGAKISRGRRGNGIYISPLRPCLLDFTNYAVNEFKCLNCNIRF